MIRTQAKWVVAVASFTGCTFGGQPEPEISTTVRAAAVGDGQDVLFASEAKSVRGDRLDAQRLAKASQWGRQWSTEALGEIEYLAANENGIAIAGTEERPWLATIDAQGTIRRHFELEPEHASLEQILALGDGGTILRSFRSLTRFDSDGTHMWAYRPPPDFDYGTADVDVDRRALFVTAFRSDKPQTIFVARLHTDGTHVWKREIQDPDTAFIWTEPVVTSTQVVLWYTYGGKSRLLGLDASDGTLRWARALEGKHVSHMVARGDGGAVLVSNPCTGFGCPCSRWECDPPRFELWFVGSDGSVEAEHGWADGRKDATAFAIDAVSTEEVHVIGAADGSPAKWEIDMTHGLQSECGHEVSPITTSEPTSVTVEESSLSLSVPAEPPVSTRRDDISGKPFTVTETVGCDLRATM